MNQTYLNTPVKNCTTCVHRQHDQCIRFGYYCSTALHSELDCGPKLRGWHPKPIKKSRRSLRQWIYDLIWRCE